ncbi:MAG: ABC transporter ATP-binding protein [Longicatena sp.]
MENSIEVHNVYKAFGKKQALQGISFQVKKGEIFAFLGPNGAGKSTMISLLTTLEKVDKGSVKIESNVLGVHNQEIRKAIGIVFQDSKLDAILSVEQNLRLRCGFYYQRSEEIRDRVNAVVKVCKLEAFMHQKVETLSGGQRRCADIARALLPKPAILILDEPSMSLDPVARKHLWSVIQELHQKEHMTIFMTTHYIEESEIASHICIIQKGKIMLDESLSQFKRMSCRNHLYLYPTSLKTLIEVLCAHKIDYQAFPNRVEVCPLNTFHTMSILRICERYIEHFNVVESSMEEIYLELVEEGVNHESVD